MRIIPYDASRRALYHPELGDATTAKTIFPLPRTPSDDLICVEASRLVYKPFESDPNEQADIVNALGLVGFGQFAPFNRGGSQAFAMWNAAQETALVAFRGTQQDFVDLGTDFNLIKRDWTPGGGWVHGGFLDYFNDIWPEIDAWLGNHPGKRLFTGHSLGAALATLAASLKPADARLVTIGSPLVGNAEFVATLKNVPVTRYVDCCGLVCRMPPAVFGFQHVTTASYIDHEGHIKDDLKEDEICQDQNAGREDYFLHHSWKVGEVDVRDLADHSPINYVNVLLNV